ncbi:DUF1501 domain-containing protein [Zavarzinella formosa]|uniref:DUF1501 domain-containing protein n=1 Tax=Zavarzinella formosa TaxID=360055 RepID=UPI00030602BC|nr:DUF1501 domain-containing protein [Zavarzinella formosa]
MLHSSLLSRRSFISLGAAGLAALPALAAGKRAAAKSVLVIFEQGGVSHMDTFDPKPEAPAEHRTPFKTIDTNVPGIRFTELLTKTASHADKLTIVRCMTQPKPGIGNSHPKGSQYIFSGESPGGAEEMPDIGSVVSHRLGSSARNLPPYIMVPGTSEQQDNTRLGFLPPQHRVFKTGGKPHEPTWTVPNLALAGIAPERFKDRADLLSNLDVGIPGAGQAKDSRILMSVREQAEDMLTNPATRKAFDLQAEPIRVRESYGLGHRGQCYLLGRKLIESGVRFVTIDCREPPAPQYPGGGNMNWDHHDHIYSPKDTSIKGGGAGAGRWGIQTWPMMGSTDQAFAALIGDMHQRGLLEETLVCFVTEFGRTPRINDRKGRDHWTHAFSFAFAGAGVPGGQIVGTTDSEGGYITSPKAYTIEDYAVTIYEKLGIDTSKPIHTPAGRPVYPGKDGHAIPELF